MILAFAVVLFRKGKLRVGVTAIDIEPATPVEPNATQLSNNVQEVFSRRPISSMISRPCECQMPRLNVALLTRDIIC